MNKQRLKQILAYLGIFVLQVLFSRINLFGMLNSVGLAFAFSMILSNKNVFFVTGSYFISKIHVLSSVQNLFIVGYEIILLSLYFLLHEYLKNKKEFLILLLMGMIANILSLYFSIVTLQSFTNWIINFTFFIAMLIYFFKVTKVYQKKLIFFRFGHGDYLMFSILVALVSLGLFSFLFIQKYLALFVISLSALLLSKIFKEDKFFIFLSIMSLSLGLISNNFSYGLISLIMIIFMVEIKDYNKWVQLAMSVVLFGVICFIFKIFDIISIISLILSLIIFASIPSKWLVSLSHIFDLNAYNLIYKYIDQQKNQEIKNKLYLMSQTFIDMQRNFKFLMVGKIDRNKAAEELAGDIISKCCNSCENFRYCFMENINKRRLFEGLILKAIQNETVGESDMTNGLQAYCAKHTIILSEINQISKLFLKFESKMKNEDSSKLLISSELGNFANIFSNFAKNVNKSLKINEKSSKILKEHFINAMVDVKEVIVLENDLGIESVNIIASNEQVLRREIIDILSKITKNDVRAKTIQHLEIAGLSLVTFVPVSKVKVNFAVSTKSKERKNGDNAIITKLSENKYFVAIADGMGHGESAERISSMVLKLIKSMFEVGLDNSLIIESVNKLLIPAGLDNFTTLDACVIDLDRGECNFIKLGASVSVLKHKNTSEIIASESLPIGIVQNIKPTIVKKTISAGDMIILASDGVVDSFSSVESYKCFINDAKIYNQQKFLDDVIFDAESQNLKHPDDMTIIGINLLKN